MKKYTFSVKLTVILLVLLMLVMAVLTGCTKETTEPTDNKPESSVSTEVKQNQETTVDNGEEDPSIDTSKHVDLILYLWGSVTDGGDAVMEVINEKLNNKINADIEIKFIDWGDIATKYPLLFASGEEFDMTFTSATANPSYFNLCSKNAFTPITDLLPEYAPLTWEKTPEYMWEDANYQGEIYGIPSRFSEYVPMGFIYRGDLLKKYNMDAVSSVEDMEAYFDKVLENEEDMSPLLVESQSYAKLYDMFIAMTGKWLKAPGLEPNTLYLSARSPDKINDIFSPVFTDEFMEFAKVMKQWETKGYLPKDVMSITEIADTQWINEKGASYLHHAQGYAGGYGGFVDSLPESDPMYFNFGDINKKVFKINAMQTATGFSVNSNNVERALMAVDLIMNTEELYKLWQYGVEGENYNIDENGYYTHNEEQPFYGTTAWMLRSDEFELPRTTDWSGKKDMFARFDSFSIKDPYSSFQFVSDNVESEIAAINQICMQYGASIIFGKVDDVESAVEDLRAKLTNAGIDKVIEEVKSQVEDYKK